MGTTVITIDQDKLAELNAAMPRVVQQAEAFQIDTTEDYEDSLPLLEGIGQRVKQIIDFFAPTKKQAYELHRAIGDQEKTMTAPYLKAEMVLKQKRYTFRQEEERKRAAEEARLREEARKKQEEELLAQAAQLEREGETEAAKVVMEQAQTAPAPTVVVESTIPKSGAGIRKIWKFRITNEDAIPRQYLIVDETKIRGVVKALGKNHGIPGVEAYEDEIEAVRRA